MQDGYLPAGSMHTTGQSQFVIALSGPRGGNAVVQSGAQGGNGGDPTAGCTSIFCN